MNKEDYFNIVDNIGDGVFQVNTDGYFTFVNKAITERYGIPLEKFCTLHFLDIVDPPYQDVVRINFQRVMGGEDGIPHELAHIDAKGHIRFMELQSSPIREGENVVGLLGISRDITARKQAEKALEESEEKYRLIVDNAREAIVITQDLRLVFVNRAAIDITGYTEEILTSRPVTEFIHPGDRNMVMENHIKRLKGEEAPAIYSYRVVRRDGSIIWAETNSVTIEWKGRPAVLNFLTDITERKSSEEKLKASDRQFKGLIESMPVGLMTIEGTKYGYVNPAIEKISGYTRDELYLMDLWDLVHPEFKDTLREYVTKQNRGESVPKLYAVKIVTKGGEERWVERRAISIELGEKPLVLIAATDITESKSAEETLRRSEEKYRSLLENASDAIVLTDEPGNIVEANRKAEELLGYTRGELLQMHYTQLHPMTELDRTIAAFKEIVKQGHGILQDGSIYRKDGKVIPVDITGSVVEYSGMKVIQGSFRDISEHKHIEDTLEGLVSKRTGELSDKNERLMIEIKERERVEASLRKRRDELKLRAGELKELNSALKVLLKQRDEDKRELEDKVMANVSQLVLPYLAELKKGRLDARSKVQASILEANLNNITSSFTHRLSSKYSGFTPREIQVANLIRQGKSTKEMAEYLRVSPSAINLYRLKVRKKLGITSRKINLRSHLMSLS